MTGLTVFLTGQKAFGAAAAEALTAAGHHLAAVASPAYADTGIPLAYGDDDMRLDALHAYADRAGHRWLEAGRLTAEAVPAVDVIVAAHSHAFIGRRTRARARLASVGYHPSLLPLHRGRDAVRWTVRDRDRVAGGSVYHLTENVDAGPLAAQDYFLVPPGTTTSGLWREHLFPLGIRLLVRVLDDLAAGRVVAVRQDEQCATWEPGIGRAPLQRTELPELMTTPHTNGSPYAADPAALRNDGQRRENDEVAWP